MNSYYIKATLLILKPLISLNVSTLCVSLNHFFFGRSNLKYPWPLAVLVLFLLVGLGVHCVWRKLCGKQQRSSKNIIFGTYKPFWLNTV